MKRISKPDIVFDNTSYIDPTSRVFYWERQVYRAFYPSASSFYKELLSSQRMKKLILQGKVIETEIAPGLQVDGFDLVMSHRRVEFPSYCFEWSANMLKEAALLTLELAMDLNQNNIMLQDASPYNIFFDAKGPVFIDFGSFTQATGDYLWGAYEQFCNFFLFPLYIYSSGNSSIPRALLKDCYTGVPAADMTQALGFIDKSRMPGYLARVSLPELLLKLSGRLRYGKEVQSLYSKFSDRIDISRIRAKFLDRLYRNVCDIRLPEPASHWTGYYEDADEEVLECKKRELQNIISRLAPRSVLDLGCNQGVFSILAAEASARVVAFDSDHDCISRLFEISKRKKYDILPLVLNILNPSPGIGWRSVQYKPSQERLKCEMVLALALIHHLVFVGGQDFERIVRCVKEFQMKWSIFEYVDQSDPKAQLLPRRPSVDYSWYTLDSFLNVLRANYAEVKILKRLSETRALILAG